MEERLILNPDYGFKNDNDRICMFAKRTLKYDSSARWIGFIHPAQATILATFSNTDKDFDPYKEISKCFGIEVETVKTIINDFKENATPVYTEFQGHKIQFPKNVLIPIEKIDTENVAYSFTREDLQCNGLDLLEDRMHRVPHSMIWMITNQCVTKCAYCYADTVKQAKLLPTQRALEIIKEAERKKLLYIDVIGGEVFRHPDWHILLNAMVKGGMSPSFISTKMPLSEKEIAKLKDTGYSNVVQISLDSTNPYILKQLVGAGPHYLEAIKETIQRLGSYSFPVQIDTILGKYTATRENLLDLQKYIKTIKNLQYWEIRVPQPTIYHRTSFEAFIASKAQIEDIKAFVEDKLIPSSDFKIIFSSEALQESVQDVPPEEHCFLGGTCGILLNSCFILPDGKITCCEQMYWHPDFIIGDLSKQSLEEVWNSPRAKELFNMRKELYRKDSVCLKCGSFENCNSKKRRCLVKVMKAYDRENWDYPDPRCIFAPDPIYKFTY